MGTVVKLRQGKHIELSFCAVLPFKELFRKKLPY